MITLHVPQPPARAERARVLERASMASPALLRALLTRATLDDVVVLDGYRHRVAAAILARRRRAARVRLTDCTRVTDAGRHPALRAVTRTRTTSCVLCTWQPGVSEQLAARCERRRGAPAPGASTPVGVT